MTIICPSLYKVILDLKSHSDTPSTAGLLKSGSSSPDISDPEKAATCDVEMLDSEAIGNIRAKLPSVQGGGGLAVCASGPLGITQEAANAVARIQMSGRVSLLSQLGSYRI